MRNIKLVIEYDGSRYDGWQKQTGSKDNNSISFKLEEVLQKMDGKPVELIGAARTEPGVHAYAQIANFHTESEMKLYEIKHYLNRYLPRDIAVLLVAEVPERFHSSFSAESMIYEYRLAVADVPSVFDRKYTYHCFKKPDAAKMRQAAESMLGKHDFKAFSDNKRMKKSTVRTIHSITVQETETEIMIAVHGDDFWPHMVRIIAGTLLEIGLGTLASADIEEIFKSGEREKAGDTLEAKGLFLKEVCYV